MTVTTGEKPTAQDLKRILAELVQADPADLDDDANLVFWGLGSLEMMRLVTRWRRQGLKVDFAELAAEPTVRAWIRQLSAAWEAGR